MKSADEINARLIRIETRLFTVMKAMGLDPHKNETQLQERERDAAQPRSGKRSSESKDKS